MVGNVKGTVRGVLLLALVAALLAAPASARPTAERGPAAHSGSGSVYRQELRARMQAEARFYASTAASRNDASQTLGYALVACLVLLAAAGAVAAWRFERRDATPAVAAAGA